jgi:hypothetical protein
MEEETVTLPKAPDGYEYILRKKSPLSGKDPSELTARQLSAKKYYEKNRQKINEKRRVKNQEEKKEEKV